MSLLRTRRTFLKQSTAALCVAPALAARAVVQAEPTTYFCVTCGTQYPSAAAPPGDCPICQDERQYVGWEGQKWATLADVRNRHKNVIKEEESGLHSIHTQPRFGIGQRAFLIRTPQGNLLWDCVPLIDDATIDAIRAAGGISGIAISHPHYYTAMIEWSHAFGKVPVHLHKADEKWVMRPDPVVQFWEGTTKSLPGGLTLINTGGHFDGFQVVHWPTGAASRGVLLSGDQPQVCQDRRWVSFMYSYPNMIPLSSAAIKRIAQSLQPFAYDRLYGAFPGLTVDRDAKGAVERSANRYMKAIT